MTLSPPQSRPNRVLRWLSLASWVVIALAFLTFFVLDLQLDYAQLLVACEGADCNYLAISQAEMDVLESWGMNSMAYSLILNGATVLGVSACWLLGSLILWRQGTTRIGWSVSLALIVIPVSAISDADNVVAHYPDLLIPSLVLSTAGTMILVGFLYLFPSGRFYPSWAYIPYIISIIGFEFLKYVLNFFDTTPVFFEQFGVPIFMSLVLLAGLFQILRYQRESTLVERQQTKWVLWGILLLITCFQIWGLIFGDVIAIPAGLPRLTLSIAGWLTIVLFTTMLPLTMTIAILRYRIWDIDFVLRRTLQYGLLTGLLALTYFSSVVILQSLLSPLSGSNNSPFAIVLSTLGIAALFNPLRQRIQHFIDRRFYRKKYHAEQALAHFAAASRNEVDIDQLTDTLLGVVEETMQPQKINLIFRKED